MSSTSARVFIQVIELVIAFQDGVAKVIPVEWARGMTVLDALRRAAAKPHGIGFQTVMLPIDDGQSEFLVEIDGQANESGESYWMFEVNGESGEVGCAECKLQPSDIVRWKSVPFDRRLVKS